MTLRFLDPLAGAIAPLRQLGSRHLIRALLPSLVHGSAAQISRHTLLRLWRGYGNREAIVDGDLRISFEGLADRAVQLARVLQEQGLKPGDHLALLAGNSALWFEAMAATSLLGIRMPLINWHLNDLETGNCIRLSGARFLLVEQRFLDHIDDDTRWDLERIIIAGSDHPPAGMLSLEALLANQHGSLPAGDFTFSPKLFSGGTTGTPKFIDLDSKTLNRRQAEGLAPNRRTLLRLAWQMLSLPSLLQLGSLRDSHSHNIRSLIPSPLYHAGGQAAAIPLFMGGTVVPMAKFDAAEFLHLIERERINWTFVTPTMLERVLALPDAVKHQHNLSSMRVMLCSAAPCPAPVKQKINALLSRQGCESDVFHEFYGSSEAGPVTMLIPADYQQDPARYASVGKARLGDCRIYDARQKTWAATGEDGKVLLRSPAVFALAYGGKSEAQMRSHFVEVDRELWYDDGLIGQLDADGFLYITGREKEMLIVGGVNIYPNEIEEILKRHPDVMDAAVVPASDKDLGEVPVAVISITDSATPVSEQQMIDFCKEQGLYGFKLPRRVIMAEHLPRDAAGKLRKQRIRQEYVDGV